MACNRKLNVDEVLEIWDEIPDDSCETDESSEDEYIPSDHDHVELSDMEFANENRDDEGDVGETNNVAHAECAAAPESSTSSNKGMKKQARKKRQRKSVTAKEMVVVNQVKLIEHFMLENGLTIPIQLEQVKQIQRHLLKSDLYFF